MSNTSEWVHVVYYYLDEARGWADAVVETIDPATPGSWGAVGSNWQVGPDFASREEAEAEARAYRKQMRARGLVIDHWNAATF